MIQSSKISSFDWLLIGLILHSIGGMFFDSSKTICYTLCGLGLVLIFLNSVFQLEHEKPFKGNIFFMFCLYLIWTVFIVLRPFVNDKSFTMDGFSLINPFTLLSYTTPLIVFLGLKEISLKSIFKYSFIQGIIGIILLILNYRNIFTAQIDYDPESYQQYLGIISTPLQFLSSTSFLVLCTAFVSTRYQIIAFSTMFLSLYTVLVSARRGSAFMFLLILLFALYLFVINSKKGSRGLKWILIATLIIVGIVAFNIYANSTFSLFFDRLDEDTRSGVEDYFFYSFKGETWDWIIGRGINGTYFPSNNRYLSRDIIETGYLQLILKGGVIYLALFIFFLGHSAYLGFFRTKNTLTKAMALNLFAHILFLVPFGIPAFNFEYIVVWVCVFYCQSKEFRMCSDTDVKGYLYFN